MWWLERQILQWFMDSSVFIAAPPHLAPNYLPGIEESKLGIGAQLLEPAAKLPGRGGNNLRAACQGRNSEGFPGEQVVVGAQTK